MGNRNRRVNLAKALVPASQNLDASPSASTHSSAARHGPSKEDPSALKARDDEAIDAFYDALNKGLKKWATLEGYTSELAAAQLLRETLLGRIERRAASLITSEALVKIHGGASTAEGRSLVNRICREMSKSIRTELVLLSGIPLRGRSRKFTERDRRIGQMRRKGLSYGQIAKRLRIKRHAVQAAYRRHRQRCAFLCEHYPELKEVLSAIGVILDGHADIT